MRLSRSAIGITIPVWLCASCGMALFVFLEVIAMPNKPLRPCLHAGCRTLTSSGYCDKHQPKRIDRRSATARARHRMYLLPVWGRLRQRQLLIEPYCRECAEHGQRALATDVDHIIPHNGDMQLFTDENNLQSLCHACHSAKTMAENRKNRGL